MPRLSRREFGASLLAVPGSARPAPGLRLIAHRGGVVDATRPENSAAAVETAIAEGYWMVEIDVRSTRDGEPVLYHDPTLAKYFADSRRVEELTWSELRRLRSNPGGRPPLHFEQACALCGGKLRLMLDLKAQWQPSFYQRLLRYMEQNRVPEPIWSLGGPAVRAYFEGKVMVSVNRKSLTAAVQAGEPVSERYFLFELGSELRAESFELARKCNVTPVAAINTFRYTMAKRDEWEGPKEDVAALRALGVTHYQIDSRYAPLFAGR
ncbi:MAG: glycerophosphodiester phosphodiesterase family protein [Bryobacterales bacterium]|nr:glycerophosphodiester phosphodiesterase family protein [Bryobacterales bacterium]